MRNTSKQMTTPGDTTEMEKVIKAYNDAIFKVVQAFVSKESRMDGQFCSGLTKCQYAALRDLNVVRIDFGDDREP